MVKIDSESTLIWSPCFSKIIFKNFFYIIIPKYISIFIIKENFNRVKNDKNAKIAISPKRDI